MDRPVIQSQCVEEVKSYVQLFFESGMIPALDGGVAKSDTRIPSFLLHGLQKTTAALRLDSSWTLPGLFLDSSRTLPGLFLNSS